MIVALNIGMCSLARRDILKDGTLIHKTWRGHNGEWIFKGDDEKLSYLYHLNKTILKAGADLHALCVMSNHSHEIYFVKNQAEFSGFIRKHHSSFGMYYNRKSNRRGPVSESRPNTDIIRDDIHEIISVLYIHANPLRAGIVKTRDELKSYEWSTHLLYGYGIYMDWMKTITMPQWYLNLGATDAERQNYYLYLFDQFLEMSEEKFIENIHI